MIMLQRLQTEHRLQQDQLKWMIRMVLPTSNSAELTDADLSGLTAQELTYARNEIYARYGYVFDSKELNDYFATKSWYTVNSAATDDSLSDLEKKNAEFIRIYQENNQLKYDVK